MTDDCRASAYPPSCSPHPPMSPPIQVVQNERLLRDRLLRDGLNPKPGYTLAR